MKKFLLASTFLFISNAAFAVCPATKANCASPTYNAVSSNTLSADTSASVNGNTITTGAAGVVWPGHGLINVQSFCASGCTTTTTTTATYTATAGTRQVIVQVQAPGGGSGGCAATSGTTGCSAGGATAGSYAVALIITAFNGVTVTMGAVGAAGSNAPGNGGTGGTASFGSIISCPGGPGSVLGNSAVAPTALNVSNGNGVAASACTISGGTTIDSQPGQQGDFGWYNGVATGNLYPGTGGPSPLSMKGPLVNKAAATGTGTAPLGWGGGASGPWNAISQAATAGLVGGNPRVLVYEYN